MELWQWLYDLSLSKIVRESFWVFPAVQCIHIYSMIALIAILSAFDMRVMGFGMGGIASRRPISEFARAVLQWVWIPFIINATTGMLMFASKAPEYRNNSAFVLKMFLIFFGMGYHVVLLRKATHWQDRLGMPVGVKVAGLPSLLVWVGVIAASRWIAYSY